MNKIRNIKELEGILDKFYGDLGEIKDRCNDEADNSGIELYRSEDKIEEIKSSIEELENELACATVKDNYWTEILLEINVEDSSGRRKKGNLHIVRNDNRYTFDFRDWTGAIIYEEDNVSEQRLVEFIQNEADDIYKNMGKYRLLKRENIHDYYKIPDRTLGSLERYVNHKICPGSFLKSVLENKLDSSIANADSENKEGLSQLVVFIHSQIPGECWGNEKAVERWLS